MNKVKLGDVVSILDSRRIPVSAADRAHRERIYPYYGAQGIVDYIDSYIFDGSYVLVAEDGNNLKTLNEPIVTWATGRFWVNNHAHILGDCGLANIRYIFYRLMASDLSGLITGSAQPKLNQQNLASFKLALPTREVQTFIANVLSSLDDKIALNKRMMNELEETAQLIYDYWFTQFDFPDECRRPYRSSGGKMVYNENLKREIPEGWKAVKVGELVAVTKGVSYKSDDLLGDGVPMVNLASFNTDGTYKPETIKTFSGRVDSRRTVRSGDLIMCITQQTSIDLTGKTNVIGKALLMPDIFDGEAVISTDVAKLSPVNRAHTFVLERLFKRRDIHKHIVGYANGTKIKHLDIGGALDFYIPIPVLDQSVLGEFACLREVQAARYSELLRENDRLIKLRDWLLPMLMNGQVKVGTALDAPGTVDVKAVS